MKGLKISVSIKIVIHQIKISEVCSALSFNKLEMNNMKFLGPHLKKHRRMATYTTIKLVPTVRIKIYSYDLKHMVMTTDYSISRRPILSYL